MSNKNEVTCTPQDLMAVKDAIQAISGTWKLQILIVLFDGPQRFKEIARRIEGISDKMLSKELKELEENLLVTRTVYETFPPKVEYSVTAHTHSLGDLISELKKWGQLHRQVVIGKTIIS